MPYTNLTNVADYDALLGEIRNFLNATGDWTIHQDLVGPDEGVASGGRQLVMSNGDVLVGLRSTDTGVGADRLYMFDGIPPYASGPTTLDSLNQNSGIRYSDGVINSSSDPGVRNLQTWAGPFPNAHLFTDDPSTYCHVVVERAAGVFVHLGFGHLHKFGTWTGGAYYGSHFWSSGVNIIDSPSNGLHQAFFDQTNTGARSWTVHYEGSGQKWIAANGGGNTDPPVLNGVTRKLGISSVRGGFGRMFKNIAESLFSGFIPLGPIVIGAHEATDTPDTVRFVGQLPDVRTINITNLSPGESLFIGADEWLAFPLMAKNGAAGQYNSGVSGLAYLKRS